MNVVCCCVDESVFLLEAISELLYIQKYNSGTSSFTHLKSFQIASFICGLSILKSTESSVLVLLHTCNETYFVWAPAFDHIHCITSPIGGDDVVGCLIKSGLIFTSKAKYYVSSPLLPNCDNINIRGDALKVTVELGSINQLLPSDDDCIIDLLSVSPGMSSAIIVLKSKYSLHLMFHNLH